MKIYKNRSTKSGITHYEIGKDFIKVKFKDNPHVYTYSESNIDRYHIDAMKELAEEGKGLSTYINQHPEVKNNFE